MAVAGGRIVVDPHTTRGHQCVRADLKPDHLVTKRCPLLPWNSGVAAGVLVGPD